MERASWARGDTKGDPHILPWSVLHTFQIGWHLTPASNYPTTPTPYTSCSLSDVAQPASSSVALAAESSSPGPRASMTRSRQEAASLPRRPHGIKAGLGCKQAWAWQIYIQNQNDPSGQQTTPCRSPEAKNASFVICLFDMNESTWDQGPFALHPWAVYRLIWSYSILRLSRAIPDFGIL